MLSETSQTETNKQKPNPHGRNRQVSLVEERSEQNSVHSRLGKAEGYKGQKEVQKMATEHKIEGSFLVLPKYLESRDSLNYNW